MRNVERAKKIAADKGVNISFVCREIGKSRGYISQMLTTDRDFPDEMLLPVANALGVTVEELTGVQKVHKMETIIYISIAAVICGAQSWNEIEEFGNAKIAFFKSRIPSLEFIPSHDTFNRFFSMIKPDYFELIFRNWENKSVRR